MRPNALRLPLTIALSLCAVLAVAQPAAASRTQVTMMEDGGRLFSNNPAVRDATLDEMKALGVSIVRVPLIWRNVAPNATSVNKPAFDATDPAQYGTGFAVHRALVNGIEARGMTALLILVTPAPAWAAPKPTKPQPGVWNPNVTDYGQFATAAGREFPDVHKWEILNEPNHYAFLAPQVIHTGISNAAIMYRRLYYAAYDGLVNSGHKRDLILFGSMAPREGPAKRHARAVHPLLFLRQFFCLDDKLKPARGRLARLLKCPRHFQRIAATGFGYHPYTNTRGPLFVPKSPDDAMIGQLRRVYRVLDRAHKYRRLTKRHIRLWNTEFNYQSAPPDYFQTPIQNIPGFLNIGEYISWKDRRVANYDQYQLYDEPCPGGDCGITYQGGLRFADGTKKPGVYDSFQMPLVVEKTRSRNKVRIWGGIRAFPGTGQAVSIQIRSGSGYKTVRTYLVTNRAGYFQTTVAIRGASHQRWRLQWNAENSRVARPIRPIKLKP